MLEFGGCHRYGELKITISIYYQLIYTHFFATSLQKLSNKASFSVQFFFKYNFLNNIHTDADINWTGIWCWLKILQSFFFQIFPRHQVFSVSTSVHLKSQGEKSSDRWFERGVKESCMTSLNRGVGHRHHSSPTYSAVLSSLPRRIHKQSHLGSPRPGNPHESRLGQQPTSGPKAHTCPWRLCEDTPTRSLKACNSPPVS